MQRLWGEGGGKRGRQDEGGIPVRGGGEGDIGMIVLHPGPDLLLATRFLFLTHHILTITRFAIGLFLLDLFYDGLGRWFGFFWRGTGEGSFCFWGDEEGNWRGFARIWTGWGCLY